MQVQSKIVRKGGNFMAILQNIIVGIGVLGEKVGILLLFLGLLLMPVNKGKWFRNGLVWYILGLLVEVIGIVCLR